MQKTIIVGIVIAVLFQLNGAHVFAQVNRNVISERTLTKEGIKYTIVKCRINYTNNPVDGELIGVKINNNWVVPCNYDSVILRNGYFYAYHGEYWADMFTTDGRLSKKWYITRMKNRQFFSDSQKDSGYDTKWYDENGKYICTGNSLMEGPGNEVFVKTGSYGREGISTIDGKVILAPEFYTCWYLGDNFFVFMQEEKPDEADLFPLPANLRPELPTNRGSHPFSEPRLQWELRRFPCL